MNNVNTYRGVNFMAKEKKDKKIEKEFEQKIEKCCGPKSKMSQCGSSGCGYFLGFIGAAVYFISNATTFWAGVIGFLKAIVWPAFLVYELLKYLGM